MTKALSKPCLCCRHFSGGIPCAKGHHPRFFKAKGLRRVCDDFDLKVEPIVKGKRYAFVEAIMRCFGLAR